MPPKKKQPLVSVCIPAYNGQEFIGRCIDSVLRQSMQDFEIIISDDGSTDATIQIAGAYKDRRIQVKKNKKNLGAEGNWNKVLSLASGKYLKLLCDDDVIYPHCLAAQVEVLADHPEVTLVTSWSDVIGPEDKVILSRKTLQGEVESNGAINSLVRAGGNIIGEPTGGLFRATDLKKAGGYDATYPYVVDLSLWTKLLEFGSLHVIPRKLWAFRVSNRSWSVSLVQSQAKDFNGMIDQLRQNRSFAVSGASAFIGKLMAKAKSYLRYIVYKIVLPSP